MPKETVIENLKYKKQIVKGFDVSLSMSTSFLKYSGE